MRPRVESDERLHTGWWDAFALMSDEFRRAQDAEWGRHFEVPVYEWTLTYCMA